MVMLKEGALKGRESIFSRAFACPPARALKAHSGTFLRDLLCATEYGVTALWRIHNPPKLSSFCGDIPDGFLFPTLPSIALIRELAPKQSLVSTLGPTEQPIAVVGRLTAHFGPAHSFCSPSRAPPLYLLRALFALGAFEASRCFLCHLTLNAWSQGLLTGFCQLDSP